MKKEDVLELEWPWEMVCFDSIESLTLQIKEALPPDHELQEHDLIAGIKWEHRPLFIVEDDTTGHQIFMNFEKMKRWKKTKYKVPTMTVFKETAELAEMINRDSLEECAKYNDDGSLK